MYEYCFTRIVTAYIIDQHLYVDDLMLALRWVKASLELILHNASPKFLNSQEHDEHELIFQMANI